MTTETMRSGTVWVPIQKVIPNPSNPRKNDAVKVEEMMHILKTKGWKEPLTAYQKGNNYILLAGHRRREAAMQLNMKELPVFVVENPGGHSEELDDIGSLQSGRVDWTDLEWMEYVYERWIAWDRPQFGPFAKQLGLPREKVATYIKVMSYFPRHEIEADIQSGSLAISTLGALVRWMDALKKNKVNLVADMGEDLIRKMMLDKIVTRKVKRDDLRHIEFCEKVSSDVVKKFLLDKNVTLEARIADLGLKRDFKDFHGHAIAMGWMRKRLPNVIKTVQTEHQAELAEKAIEEMIKDAEIQLKQIRKQFPKQSTLL